MENDLRQPILRTLAYFDVFGYPLTKEELWRYLCIDCTDLKLDYTDFLLQIDGVTNKNGFCLLPGREENVATRQRAVKWVEQKMKIAKRAIKKLRWVPFLRAVFVCNTLGGVGLMEDSDIDVFVVVRKGRMWLTRMLVTLTLCLFRMRRTKKKTKNKICLSFYTSDDSLNLEKIALPQPDIYLIYWIEQMIPVYDTGGVHLDVQMANKWVKRYLPNAFVPYELPERWRVNDSGVLKPIKNLLEKMWGGRYGDLIEHQAREAQKARMKMNYMSVQNEPDTRVVVSDNMLKFHENDRRSEYRDKWREKVEELPHSF